ncbi:TPR domain protein [Penicillium antarcticum]|nr:TPR domain protein [Penicillium antarcticum]KAJ5308726.1 TPR domain protein [Penicillium antarcticum]
MKNFIVALNKLLLMTPTASWPTGGSATQLAQTTTRRLFDPTDLKHVFKICYHASKEAEDLIDEREITPVERALIKAMQSHFPVNNPVSDCSALDKAYAAAMEQVYQAYGVNDLNNTTLYVDALMHTALRKIPGIFETALANRASDIHPGILHFWVHFMEMSNTPAVALPAANKLRHIVPNGGHIHHMPTHLDVLVGDYRASIDPNTEAVKADERFLAKRGARNFYSFYGFHNYHSLIYAALLSGQRRIALEATDLMEASITDELLRVGSPPMADWMEFSRL